MKSTVRKIIPFLYVAVIGQIVVISSLSVLFLYIYFTKNEDITVEPEVYSYQQSEINGETGEITLGALSVFEELLSFEDFISYETEVGNHVLISHQGLNEYKCTGTCFCEKNQKMRSTGIISSSGLMYLVAAVSGAIALNYARSHFEEECENEMRKVIDDYDYCPIGSIIHSKIDECQVLTEISTPTKEEQQQQPQKEEEEEQQQPQKEEEQPQKEEDWGDINEVGGGWDMMSDTDMPGTNKDGEPPSDVREKKYDHYRCFGNCVPRLFVHPLDNQEVKRFNCLKLWLHMDVWVEPDPRNKDWEYGLDWEADKADNIFIQDHLHSWCLWQSLSEYMDRDGSMKKTALCLGYDISRDGDETNNSVLCRKVWPKPLE